MVGPRQTVRSVMSRLGRAWVVRRVEDAGGVTTIELRRKLPLLLLAVFTALQVFFPSRVWVTLLLAFACLLAISTMWAWQMARGIRMRRRLRYPLVQVGDLLEEQFWLENESILPALWVEIVDHSSMPDYDASTVRTVGGQTTYRWISSDLCSRRGEFLLGPWEAITRDPFGVFGVVRTHADSQSILVYPPIADRLPFSLPRGSTAGLAHVSNRSWEPTVTIGGVRAYAPGDPRHHIHWPTTARRAQLFAKEFDQETGGDVWLVLDLDANVQAGSGSRSTLEMGIVVAGSAAAAMLHARRAVGLAASGPEGGIVVPGRGSAHLWTLLRALAKAHSQGALPLAQVLSELCRVLTPGSTALVVTPSLDSAWVSELVRLRARGIGASVVLLDALSFDAPSSGLPAEAGTDLPVTPWRPSGAADVIRGLLADVQVSVEIVDADAPLKLRPATGQVRRWEFKVLATGRALAISTPGEQAA